MAIEVERTRRFTADEYERMVELATDSIAALPADCGAVERFDPA